MIIALAVVSLLIVAGCTQESGAKPRKAQTPSAPVMPPPVTVASGCDPKVANFPYHVAYARNEGVMPVYDAPNGTELGKGFVHPRLTEGNPPVEEKLTFLVKNEPQDDCSWVEVYLPTRPNGSTGWVKRADIDMEGHTYRIQVRLSDFNLQAWEGDTLLLDAPIATAANNTPTPGGIYYITEVVQNTDPNALYGPWAMGLSGYSETLSSFNGGSGQLGIHGTNEPHLIGTQVSHGCIRLLNEDIEYLVDVLQTWYGIPVAIYP